MNRLKILLITGALITGGSALASAQENYQTGFALQVRLGSHEGERDRNWDRDRYGYYGYGDGDHDRDDRYAYRHWRWRDRDDRFFHRDRGDRRRGDRDDRGHNYDRDHDGDRD